jgi:hypothetical protein
VSFLTASDVELMDDDPAVVDAAASALRTTASPVRTSASDVELHWQGLGAVYSAPEQGVLFAAVGPARTAGDELATATEQIADALAAYAEALRPLLVMQQELLTDLGEMSAAVGAWSSEGDNWAQPDGWASDPELAARDSSLRRTASGIRSAVLDAERDCARALDAVAGGTGAGLRSVSDGAASTLRASGTWSAVVSDFDHDVDAAAMTTLRELATKDQQELEAWVAANEERIHSIIDAPPSAEATEAWWSELGPAGQALLVSGASLLVGNLDGVPWGRRSEANHVTLRTESDRLRRAIAEADEDADADEAERWQKQLDSYQDLLDDEVTYRSGDEVQTVTGHHVIVFDPSREAIAEYVGYLDADGRIPDTTVDVGTFVPGTNSKLESFSDNTRIARNLADKANPRGSLGMLVWQGGHFPQDLEAIDAAPSRDLAPRLARAVDGLPVAEGTDTTVIGYSYGSAVVGLAEAGGMSADRVMYVSGAGLGHGVEGIDEFPETRDVPHYATLAPGDYTVGLIQGTQGGLLGGEQGHGTSPLGAEGVVRLETGYVDDSRGRESGALMGHQVWTGKGTSSMYQQVFNVLTDGPLVAYADDGQWHNMYLTDRNLPIMADDYQPRHVR